MTNREWGLVALLISVVQAFIWYSAFVNAGNGSALNYVSFAGTLISIILAVLAIGYTYGESISQKGKGDTLASQIATLTEVTRGMKIQAESLEQVSTIQKSLSDVASRIERGFIETSDKVSGVYAGIDRVREKVDEINLLRESPVKASRIDKRESAHALLAARMPLLEISLLYILAISKKTDSSLLSADISVVVREHIESAAKKVKPDSPGEKDRIAMLFSGSIHSVVAVLQGFGLITVKDEAIAEIDSSLMEEIVEVLKNPTGAGTFYTAIREELIISIAG